MLGKKTNPTHADVILSSDKYTEYGIKPIVL